LDREKVLRQKWKKFSGKRRSVGSESDLQERREASPVFLIHFIFGNKQDPVSRIKIKGKLLSPYSRVIRICKRS
jgi:hypothetical protein